MQPNDIEGILRQRFPDGTIYFDDEICKIIGVSPFVAEYLQGQPLVLQCASYKANDASLRLTGKTSFMNVESSDAIFDLTDLRPPFPASAKPLDADRDLGAHLPRARREQRNARRAEHMSPDGSSTAVVRTTSIELRTRAAIIRRQQQQHDASEGVYSLGTDWKFSNSFANLPLTVGLHGPNAYESFLNSLQLTDPRFVVISVDEDEGDLIAKGVNFIATIKLDGSLGKLSRLSESPIEFAGAVVLDAEASRLTLAGKIPLGVKVPWLSVKSLIVSIVSGLDDKRDADSRDADSYMEIRTYVDIGKSITVPIAAELPMGKLDFVLLRSDLREQPIDINSLSDLVSFIGIKDLTTHLPKVLQEPLEFRIEELSAFLKISTMHLGSLRATVSTETAWQVHPRLPKLNGVSLAFGVEDPLDEDVRRLDIVVCGDFELEGALISGRAEFPRNHLSASLLQGSTLRLPQLLNHFDIKLGDIGIEDLAITTLDFSADLQTLEWGFAVDIRGDWRIDLGLKTVELRAVTFRYRQHNVTEDAKLSASALFDVGDVVMAIYAEHSAGEGWHFVGELESETGIDVNKIVSSLLPNGLKVPEEILNLDVRHAELMLDTAGPSFTLSLKSDSKLFFGEVATLSLKGLYFAYAKGEASTETDWRLALQGGLELSKILSLQGELVVRRAAAGTMLSFTPDTDSASVTLPIPLPGEEPRVTLTVKAISVSKLSEPLEGYRFEADGSVSFNNLGKEIDRVVPKTAAAALTIDASTAVLRVSALTKDVQWTLPAISTPAGDLALGNMAIAASSFALTVGDQPELAVDLHIGFPSELNSIFGTRDGKPNINLFRTYDSAQPKESSFQLRLAVDANGITIKPLNSPIKPMKTEIRNDVLWWDVDMGDFGFARLRVPEFRGSPEKGFTARAGFELCKSRPLSLPLTPVKEMLKLAGHAEAADVLPKKIPLRPLNVINGKGHLDVDRLRNVFGTLPKELDDALQQLAEYTKRLPDRFKRYLQFDIPHHLVLDIGVGADGSLTLRFEVGEDDRPFRLLWPDTSGTQPWIYGLELHSLTFGEILGGQLGLLCIDATLDIFDIVTLAAALLVPENLKLLPDPTKLQRTLILKNLMAPVVYQAGVPIPIPLFYDQLGFEYLGIEGLELQTHVAFPQPSPNLAGVADAMNRLIQFVTVHDYRLEPEPPPQGLDLRFDLGPNYLRLPQLVGGQLLGKEGELTSIDLWSNVAHLLNGLKSLQLKDLVRAIPREHRVGNEEISFLGLDLNVRWAFATRAELAEAHESALTVLPSQGERTNKGIVLLLIGKMEASTLAGMEATLGTLVSNLQGFATGFRFTGQLAQLVQVDLTGSVAINPKSKPVLQVSGGGEICVVDTKVLSCELAAGTNGIKVSGMLDLVPGVLNVNAGGKVTGELSNQGLNLNGTSTLVVKDVTLINGTATVDGNGARLSGSWLGTETAFAAESDNNGRLCLRGDVEIDVALEGRLGPVLVADARLTDGFDINASVRAVVAATVNAEGFHAGINGTLQLSNLPAYELKANVSVAPADAKTIADALWKELEGSAEEFVKCLFPRPEDWLGALKSGALGLSADVGKSLGQGLAKAYEQNIEAGTSLLRRYKRSPEEVGLALVSGWQAGSNDIARVMSQAKYPASHAGRALKAGLGLDASASSIAAGALKQAKYSVEDVGRVLKDTFTNSADEAAKALWEAKYTASEAGMALKGTFTDSTASAGKAFQNAGYVAKDVERVLTDTFKASVNEVAGVMLDVYDVAEKTGNTVLNGIEETGKVFKKLWPFS